MRLVSLLPIPYIHYDPNDPHCDSSTPYTKHLYGATFDLSL